jgi:hypothetical protein
MNCIECTNVYKPVHKSLSILVGSSLWENKACVNCGMKNIDHLSADERQHYILCDCGEYIDMRDLSEVFHHLHGTNAPEPQWSYSIKKGDPAAYPKSGKRIDLN